MGKALSSFLNPESSVPFPMGCAVCTRSRSCSARRCWPMREQPMGLRTEPSVGTAGLALPAEMHGERAGSSALLHHAELFNMVEVNTHGQAKSHRAGPRCRLGTFHPARAP